MGRFQNYLLIGIFLLVLPLSFASIEIDFWDDYSYDGLSRSDGIAWYGDDLEFNVDISSSSSQAVVCFDWCGDGIYDGCYAESDSLLRDCKNKYYSLNSYCDDGADCGVISDLERDFEVDTTDRGAGFTCEVKVKAYEYCLGNNNRIRTDSERYYVLDNRIHYCTGDGDYDDLGFYYDGIGRRSQIYLGSDSCSSSETCEEDTQENYGRYGTSKPDLCVRAPVCGDGLCEDGEGCTQDCLVIDTIDIPSSAMSGENVEVEVRVENIGSERLEFSFEAGFMPRAWLGPVGGLSASSYDREYEGCCPGNRFFSGKIQGRVDPYDRHTIRTTITVPSQNTRDTCNGLGNALSDDMILFAGIMNYCFDEGPSSEYFDADYERITILQDPCNYDGLCTAGETFANCPSDCFCNNDEICNDLNGENEQSCPFDCLCDHDNICEAGETIALCTGDCGCNNNGRCEESRGEDWHLCPNECEEPCDMPDGRDYDCDCDSDADCKPYGANLFCNQVSGPDACEVRNYADECSNHYDYFCAEGSVKYCAFDSRKDSFVVQHIESCSGAYEYCDPIVVDGTGACSETPEHLEVGVDYAKGSITVNKQPSDIINLRLFTKSPGRLLVNYDTSVFTAECDGDWNFYEGENWCTFTVKESATKGKKSITVGRETVTVNIVEEPDFLVVTDSDKLYQRFLSEPTGVSALLAQAYVSAGANGVVYDLSDYTFASQHPFLAFYEYGEQVLFPRMQDNSYTTQVSSFILSKCSNCKDIMIVGDDFVVPHYRREISGKEKKWLFGDRETTDYLYTDINYIKKKPVEFRNYYDMFKIQGEYQGKDVMFILPDNLNSTMRAEVDAMKRIFDEKGYNLDYSEISGRQTYCYDQTWFSDLKTKTLIIIGTQETNRAFNCMPFVDGQVNSDSAFLARSEWDKDEFALILNTDNPGVVKAFNELVDSGEVVNLKSEGAYFFDVGTEYAGYGALIFAVGVSTVGSGGTAPVALASIAYFAEIASESSDLVNTCYVNYDGAGWCGATIGMAFTPFVQSKITKKGIKNIQSSTLPEELAEDKEFVTEQFDKLLGVFDPDSYGRLIKNKNDLIQISKGTQALFGNVRKSDMKEEVKLIREMTDEQRLKYIKGVGKVQEWIDNVDDVEKKDKLEKGFENLIKDSKHQDWDGEAKGPQFELESFQYENMNNIEGFSKNIDKTDVGIPEGGSFTELDKLRKDGTIVEDKMRPWSNAASEFGRKIPKFSIYQNHVGKSNKIIFRVKNNEPLVNNEELDLAKEDLRRLSESFPNSEIELEHVDFHGKITEIDYNG